MQNGIIAETHSVNCAPPNSNPHSRCIMELTQAYLKTILHYDPETGVFTWATESDRRAVGNVADRIYDGGYARIWLLGRFYLSHRLAFLWMTGRFPHEHTDHVNGARSDNRWINLRSVSPGENHKNMRRYICNTSGVPGVRWHKRDNIWEARIRIDGKDKHLGRFEEWFESVCARKSAEIKHGFHQNHGRAR